MQFAAVKKRISRALVVSWRDQPSRYDIEALQANVERVGLVIRLRWALVIVLAIYSVLASTAYLTVMEASELSRHMTVPSVALFFVLLYNSYYTFTYRHLGNIAVLNHLQLYFDVIVVAVLVYYSGGIHSWFWSLMALFIVEAAFILPRKRDAWLLAAFSAASLGAIVWGEWAGVISHVELPFADPGLHRDSTYVAVRYLWQVTILAGAASVATLMTGALRRREAALGASSITDEKTGLYDRRYFNRALHAEARRAIASGRPLHVILIDLYHFSEFNERFGIQAGDRMLTQVAEVLTAEVMTGEGAWDTTNVVSRYGGEEFAILLAESTTAEGPATPAEAIEVAERACARIMELDVGGASVRASVGVASMPGDAITAEDLLAVADDALARAAAAGGACVVEATGAT